MIVIPRRRPRWADPEKEEERNEAKPVHRPLQPAGNRRLLPRGTLVDRDIPRPVGPARRRKPRQGVRDRRDTLADVSGALRRRPTAGHRSAPAGVAAW